MGNPTIIERLRELIGHIAWHVFLWSIHMTSEQYVAYVVDEIE